MSSRQTTDNFLLPSVLLVVFVFVSCAFADLIGSPLLVFFVLWGPALVYLFVKQPVHIIARVLVLLGCVLESPSDRPGNGYWVPPFAPANTVMYGGLNKWLGLPGGSFPLFLVLWITLLVLARKACRTPTTRPTVESRNALHLYLFGIVLAVIWGVVRGGQIQPMFWQLIDPMMTAVACLALLWSIRGKEDLHAVGTIIVVVAVTKAILVFWVFEVICRPLNIRPFFATTHSDSVTFAAAFAVILNRAFEERSKKAIRNLALLTPVILMAVYMNNRRLAFVSIGATVLIAVLFLKSKKLKRKLVITAIALSPLVAAYFVVGANSDSPIFALAKSMGSVSSSSDASSKTRDIENFNLHVTLKRAVLGGTGFGHEYVEFVQADDISKSHALYRYIPHNSVLWIVSVGGILFFSFLWLPYTTLSFLAFRAYRIASTQIERAAALTAVCIVLIYLMQAYGDMAINTDTPGVILAVGYAVAARLDRKPRTKAPKIHTGHQQTTST